MQAIDASSAVNIWDDGYPSGGNFWSDYTGTDNFSGPGQDIPGSDGIGDTPYAFVGAQDNYPLMRPFLNEPPVADAGANQTIEWTSGGAQVTLDGSASSDPDGDTLTYTWTGLFSEGDGTVTGVSPTVTLPSLGAFTIALTVDDGWGGTDTDTVRITVVDTTAPNVTAALLRVCEDEDDCEDDDEQLFRVEYSCSDSCDSDPTITSAKLNGIPVADGQLVEMEMDDDDEAVEWEDEVLHIEASSFELVVTCEDASGNAGTASATPMFADDEGDD